MHRCSGADEVDVLQHHQGSDLSPAPCNLDAGRQRCPKPRKYTGVRGETAASQSGDPMGGMSPSYISDVSPQKSVRQDTKARAETATLAGVARQLSSLKPGFVAS